MMGNCIHSGEIFKGDCLTHGWFAAIVLGVVLFVLLISCLFTLSCCIYYCVKSRKKIERVER